MKIVVAKCGLGNQMFQYALYRKLELLNQDVRWDISYILNNIEHNGYELEDVFNILPQKATEREWETCKVTKGGAYGKLRSWLTRKSFFGEIERFVNRDVFVCDNMILDGFWQHPDYFAGIEDVLRRDFAFSNFSDERNIFLQAKMEEDNAVCIHVRKGDYLSDSFREYYGSICDVSYYQKAIAYMRENLIDPVFYVFTDDLKWVQINLELPSSTVYVTHNSGKNSYKDMQLMSYCKNLIIANSTFSWWAAWLNAQNNKLVIAPKKWCISKRKYKNALCLKEWILL